MAVLIICFVIQAQLYLTLIGACLLPQSIYSPLAIELCLQMCPNRWSCKKIRPPAP